MNQLVEILNCEYRDGRASTAPQLKMDTVPMPDGHVAALDEDINNHEPAHDPDILPHNYNDEDLSSIFPRAIAPERPRRIPPQPQAPSHDGVWRENC